jgi:hypothetical protein
MDMDARTGQASERIGNEADDLHARALQLANTGRRVRADDLDLEFWHRFPEQRHDVVDQPRGGILVGSSRSREEASEEHDTGPIIEAWNPLGHLGVRWKNKDRRARQVVGKRRLFLRDAEDDICTVYALLLEAAKRLGRLVPFLLKAPECESLDVIHAARLRLRPA